MRICQRIRLDISDVVVEVRCECTEHRIAKILEEMRRRSEISYYIWARANSTIDTEGIDFLIFPEQDWALAIIVQAKSSVKGKKKHQESRNEWKRQIPCLVITDDMTPTEVLTDIRAFVQETLQKICERHNKKTHRVR